MARADGGARLRPARHHGPGELFGSARYAAGCVFDLEVAGGWTNGDADGAGQPIRRELVRKPMDAEWPDRTRRPLPWSVYECRAHIKYREQDTDLDAFEKCYGASRAVHERP